jgi:TPR repeat protein
MRLASTHALLAALLSLWLTTSAWAGFDEGWAAFERGDYAMALEEWLPVAKLGHSRAQGNLGFMYNEGLGVPRDYAEALRWHRAAAEQGNANAQNNLGYMFDNGLGVTQNYIQAHMWFNLAAASGNESARENRDIAAKRMTPADISEAQHLAREWLEEHGE